MGAVLAVALVEALSTGVHSSWRTHHGQPGWCLCRSEHRAAPLVCERGEEQGAGFGGCGALAAAWVFLWGSREGSGTVCVRKYRSCSAAMAGCSAHWGCPLSRRGVALSVSLQSRLL